MLIWIADSIYCIPYVQYRVLLRNAYLKILLVRSKCSKKAKRRSRIWKQLNSEISHTFHLEIQRAALGCWLTYPLSDSHNVKTFLRDLEERRYFKHQLEVQTVCPIDSVPGEEKSCHQIGIRVRILWWLFALGWFWLPVHGAWALG